MVNLEKKATWSATHEHLIILGLCTIGALRVFVFNAAFPLVNNVDEPWHLDLVYKYSRGQVPRHCVEKLSIEVLELRMLYRSPEYLYIPGGRPFPPPLWTIPNMRQDPKFIKALTEMHNNPEKQNKRCGSVPVYYAVAGLWYRAGEMLGITGGQLLYWLRFLNVPLFALFVWVSYAIARSLYEEGDAVRIAFPLLAAFFPQDVFYSISNDALSPLLFGAAFLMLVQIYNHNKSYLYHLLAGLFVAATFLTKFSNIAVLAMLAAGILFKLKQSYSANQVRQHLPKLFVLSAAAIVPIAMWLARSYFVLGDLTGMAAHATGLGWTKKPANELVNHPIFTPKGTIYFLTELTKTFWRGEFWWHRKAIASRTMDIFYVLSTMLLMLVCIAAFLAKRKITIEKRFAISTSLIVLIISVLFLAVLSIIFDFGNCMNPSREKPYFISGRLMGGALLPFLVIYFEGLGRLLSFLRSRQYLLLIVLLIITAVTWSEISISMDVFKSQYNWFHLK